jgi:hypothetical protein
MSSKRARSLSVSQPVDAGAVAASAMADDLNPTVGVRDVANLGASDEATLTPG